jgi:hypothetical protein
VLPIWLAEQPPPAAAAAQVQRQQVSAGLAELSPHSDAHMPGVPAVGSLQHSRQLEPLKRLPFSEPAVQQQPAPAAAVPDLLSSRSPQLPSQHQPPLAPSHFCCRSSDRQSSHWQQQGHLSPSRMSREHMLPTPPC